MQSLIAANKKLIISETVYERRIVTIEYWYKVGDFFQNTQI